MGVEWENAREAIRLAKKDPPSNITLVLGLYALSCKDKERGKVARSSYYFMRHMDDLLDGDLKADGNPLSLALDIRQQIDSESYKDWSPLSQVARYSIDTLRARSNEGDDPKADFLQAVDSMIFDYGRSKERRVLTRSELDEYYRHTFSPVVNILLVGLKSKLRTQDVPAMSITQGRLYTLRDLAVDWPRGTINIPQEVLEEAGLRADSSLSDVNSNDVIRTWANTECEETLDDLNGLKKYLDENAEPLVNLICVRMTKWMIKFAEANSSAN